MSETRPTGEQLRFVSAATGEHILDTYLEAAEKGGRTLADMLSDIYDPITGLFRADYIEFRITSARQFQFRVGDFPDTTSGWQDVASNPSLFGAKGAWAATTVYAQTDIVTYTNSTYYCLVPHTSTSTFDATKWAVMSDGTALNTATSTASTSATAAAASAATAATSATTATTKAAEAVTSATAAAASATTAGTQAATATTKATEANTSANSAATSSSNASASALTASNAATTATTKANEANSSASSASNSATTATTQATLATSKAADATNAAAAASADAATALTRMVGAETAANAASASAAAALNSEQGANTSAASVSGAAVTATAKASEAAASAAAISAVYGDAVSIQAAVQTAQSQASLAQGYALSASSVVQQDLSGITAQALHRSPNAITAQFIYDTSKDSDGGAWTEKCQQTSWYNEALAGRWLGPQDSEFQARNSGSTISATELVTNGNFDTDVSGWLTAGCTVSKSGSAMRITDSDGGTGYAYRSVTLEIGKTYFASVRVTLDAITGSLTLYMGTTSGAAQMGSSSLANGPGTISFFFTATATTGWIAIRNVTAIAGEYWEVDNISVREVTALNTASNDYFQLTTDGKFYRLWKNLLSQTDALETSVWSRTNATVTANAATNPLSGLGAEALIEASDTNLQHSVSLTGFLALTGTYTLSVALKANGRNWAALNLSSTIGVFDTNSPRAWFDLQTGVVGTVGVPTGSGTTASITAVGNGWYRCSITFTFSISSNRRPIVFTSTGDGLVSHNGDGASGILIGGFQLETSTVATTYEAKVADASTSEIFRGNKADFPRLAAIVAEAASVTIYDLTEAGRPMWATYRGVRDYTSLTPKDAWGIQPNVSAIAASNGFILIGNNGSNQSPSYGSGVWRLDYPADYIHQYTGVSYAQRRWNGVSAFNASPAQNLLPNGGLPNVTINAVAMTVLPDAPIDPATGLRVPTIAVATAGGVSVIKHNGTVVNSSSTAAFSTVGIGGEGVYGQRGSSVFYEVIANPNTLPASFTLVIVSNGTAPDWVTAVGGKAFRNKRNFLSRYGDNSNRVQLLENNEAAPTRSLGAAIAPTYNTGWLTGDIRRAYLSDATVGALASEDYSIQTLTLAQLTISSTVTVSDLGDRFRITKNATDGLFGTVHVNAGAASLTVGRLYYAEFEVLATGPNNNAYTSATHGGGGAFIGAAYTTGYYKRGAFSIATGAGTGGVRFEWSVSRASNPASSAAGDWIEVSKTVIVRRADDERSYKAQGAILYGTLAKSQLASGTSLVGYSGFSASNYLREPYSADLDFGTGEWTATAWVNVPATLPEANFPAVGSELVDTANTATAWTIFGTNTVTQDGDAVKVTFGSDDRGAYIYLTQAAGLNANLVAGKSYQLQVQLRVNTGSANFAIYQTSFGNYVDPAAITQTDYITRTYKFTYVSGTPYIQFANLSAGEEIWIRNVSVRELAASRVVDRSHSSGPYVRLGVNYTGTLTAEAFDGTTTRTVTTTAAYNTATWLKAEANYTTDGSLTIRVNGREVAATRGNPLLTLNNTSAVLTIGNNYAADAPFPGTIALLKLGATVPTPEQATFMYEQEKQLFRANALSVLPDTGSVVDMAYDDATDRWVAVSAANESYWTGLVRNTVTPVPAGSYTKIVATSGIELAARSTTNPGVDVTIPAYGLREELVKRAEAAARLGKELATFDYVGGFTANTTNGNTAITSASTITYPASYIGARISGSGIPTNAIIVAVSGTTLYLSAAATATATGVSITFLDFALPAGMEARTVFSAGVQQREGATAAFTRLYDGFIETIRFGTAPGATALVTIQAQRISQ